MLGSEGVTSKYPSLLITSLWVACKKYQLKLSSRKGKLIYFTGTFTLGQEIQMGILRDWNQELEAIMD